MPRTLTYFVSDVHLGLAVADPSGREARFVEFLRGIPAAKTESLYLLGDIWDFWYEYRDVVPKGNSRHDISAALLSPCSTCPKSPSGVSVGGVYLR